MVTMGESHTTFQLQNEDDNRDQKRNKNFTYPSWIHASSQIRLFRVTDATSTQVAGTLELCNISELPATEYVALSYCWGEARTDNDIRPILVNGQPFWVRSNLWTFLQTFGSLDTGVPIYIDAICLNQLDNDERGEQVKLMSEIYRHADRTLVWLGNSSSEQDDNLSCLQSQLSQESAGELWATQSITGLSYLCSKPYWRRLWIVQELLLSSIISIHCGTYVFAWADIIGLARLPLTARFFSNPEDTDWWSAWTFPRPRDYSQQGAQEDRTHDGWQPALRLFHYREQWLARSRTTNTDTEQSEPGFPFHEALNAFRYQQCLDRKDKIFALIGLLDREGREMITPSYDDSVQDVFQQAAAAGLVSLWNAQNSPPHEPYPTHADRMYCDALNTILGLPEYNIETRISQAVARARSYIQSMHQWHSDTSLGLLTCQHSDLPKDDLGADHNGLSAVETYVTDINQESSAQLAFRAFTHDLTAEEVTDYAAVDLKRLKITMAAIQRRQRANEKLVMQDMTRLRGFIEALEPYGEVADAFMGLHRAVAFVWGSVKFLLEVTYNWPDAFDGLLCQYKRLGESIPAMADVQALPNSHHERSEVASTVFRCIFDFHRLTLKYFKAPAWRELFAATWKQLEIVLGGFADTLNENRLLIMRRANTFEAEESRQGRLDTSTQLRELLEEAKRARQQADESLRQLQADEIIKRRDRVISWLSAPDALSDQNHGRDVRSDCPNSGRWLLQNPRYRLWNDPHADTSPLLWIHGIPGSGKSVLASLVVDECLNLSNATTVFFYCKHDDSRKNTFVAMARALLHQLCLLRLNDEVLLTYLFELATTRGEMTLGTAKLAREALKTCLKTIGQVYVIVDGIDECLATEQKHIADFWKSHADDRGYFCHCVMLSQHDESTSPLFLGLPAIRIHGELHNYDILSYCLSKTQQIEQKFRDLSQQELETISVQTWHQAQSMFLFARVVMENLFDQECKADLLAEMSPDSFPRDIGEAYSRIVGRVLNPAKSPQRSKSARKLLALVACAGRSLKWREIQAAVALEPGAGLEEYTGRLLVGTFRDRCGALLEELPNGDIEFVHSTAKMYLLEKRYLELGIEHLKLSDLCLNYLSLPAYSADIDNAQIEKYIQMGLYSFMEYAMVHWTTHLGFALESYSNRELLGTLERALESFFELHWKTPQKRCRPTKRIAMLCKTVVRWNSHAKVRDSMSSMHCLMWTSLSDTEAVHTLDLFVVLARVRTVMQRMQINPELESRYGLNIFKCPRIYCKWFHEGFAGPGDQSSHIERHERSHLCARAGCLYATLGFPTAKELSVHVNSAHGRALTEHEFPNEDADEDPTPTARTDDLRRESNSGATSPTDHTVHELMPAPRHDRGEDPSSDDPAHHQEQQDQPRAHDQRDDAQQAGLAQVPPVGNADGRGQQVTANFQCSLCPRSFTRHFNLEVHLRIHTGERPFKCTVCGQAFTKQHDRKRHQELHTGEKNFVCGGTLQNGSPWGCGKRFARAAGRSRHYKSGPGQVCVKPLRDEEAVIREQGEVEEQQQQPRAADDAVTGPS